MGNFRHLALWAIVAIGLTPAPAPMADPSNPFLDGGSVTGQQLRFSDGRGGTFRPRTLVLTTDQGTTLAVLPETSDDARSEDIGPRDKFSHGMGLGQKLLSREFLEKQPPIGEVFRTGDTLFVRVPGDPGKTISGLPVALSTDTSRYGPVSYRLGMLIHAAQGAGGTEASAEPIGDAFIAHEMLVLSARPTGAPSISDILKDLF